jgi:hypothetical protein
MSGANPSQFNPSSLLQSLQGMQNSVTYFPSPSPEYTVGDEILWRESSKFYQSTVLDVAVTEHLPSTGMTKTTATAYKVRTKHWYGNVEHWIQAHSVSGKLVRR